MLKKHQILEQAVEDYAETVHQLSKTSRTLVADNHPERYWLPFLIGLCVLLVVQSLHWVVLTHKDYSEE